MIPGIIVLHLLTAIFAVIGIVHLLFWVLGILSRAHLWLALGALAAAGALAAYGVSAFMADPPIDTAQRLSMVFCTAWLITMTWFTVEYVASGATRRRLAMVLTVMFTAVLLGNLGVPAQSATLLFFDEMRPLGILNDIALLGLCGLVADATVRAWRSKNHFSAVVMGIGMGVALLQILLYGTLLDLGLARLPSPVPHAFLPLALLMTYPLALSVEASRSFVQREREGLMHTSRLAIVGELTASVAHEINQPLGAILSNTEAGEILLARADPPLEEIRQILLDIRRDGLRASNVIRQVRTLVRNQVLALEKLDANAVALEVIALLDPDARARRIHLEPSLMQVPAYIHADPTRIGQVLINLLLNAMDALNAADAAMPLSASRMVVSLGVTRTAHGHVEFHVVDAGPGIPTERLGNLFDSFYTSKAHGMGLGLSIARSIVQEHGGWIQVENNADAGATFRVTLPPFEREMGQTH